MCDRTACKEEKNHYKIWNNPTTEKGYREYCLQCGSKIIGYNEVFAEDNKQDLLKWQFYKGGI